jgi:hypothetical protein
MLFEIRPDLFPQGYLTDGEIALWDMYIGSLNEQRKHG